MNITNVVAQNIRLVREKKGLTLDEASAVTGVSRSMLSQIEKGTVNPTVTVLWKIAEGYRVPFTSLFHQATPEVALIRATDTVATSDCEGKFKNYSIFPYTEQSGFETHFVAIEPNGVHETAPHASGTEEYITVASGILEITVGESTFVLRDRDSIHFKADVPHLYRNAGNTDLTYYLIMTYQQ